MMKNIQLGDAEAQFANLVWEHEPVTSTQLVTLAAQALGWKKSTTYTVLRRLCEKNLMKNEDAVVTSCVSKSEYLADQSRQFVEEHFGGSIPMFLVSFREKQDLSEEDWALLRRMVEEHEVK
ncbi:MAG: BlaI/MecI/CopY family transcriptional regulator [Clostridia bacterium]|nr:BlaI/MecI/CopY family transcriptional regulator [Clostridia bacterium]